MLAFKGWPFVCICSILTLGACDAAAPSPSATLGNPLALPAVGSHELRILSPTLLELSMVSSKEPDPARVVDWNFVSAQHELGLPDSKELDLRVGGRERDIMRLGFKRRVLYAPLQKRDLRIGNYLYLALKEPLVDGEDVEVITPQGGKWGETTFTFKARMEPLRWSPAIHVNQVGYCPSFPKKAMIGYYLGSLGELGLDASSGSKPANFTIIDARSGSKVFSGPLRLRPDRGFTFPCYQQVWEADFTELQRPGEYRLTVPGLGGSFPFWIDEGVFAAFARAYALGLYHQRCGTANELPYTRFTHEACHTAPAEVPTMRLTATQQLIKRMSDEGKGQKRHTAQQLQSVDTSLYPFVRKGRADVSGGHHDAGDYSKYTINSAALIHSLVFAVDAFSGVASLDNLGIPESGDGKSDLLQEAKWEADFLVKMQDEDGGFSFLVYPKERPYEDDTLPDKGDPQVVFPKNTSATAAAVAALAQASSSPLFRKQFPEAAARYFEAAKKGWAFLENAIVNHGRDGSYQKLSHYGNEFQHDDELVWAATELFVATGNPAYERQVLAQFNPTDRETKRCTWWRLYEGYGCAIRSYAFAAKTGRLQPAQLNSNFLAQCWSEITAAGQDQLRFARECAYGSSFPDPNKRFRNAGWYFSNDQAFDLATAWHADSTTGGADRRSDLIAAMVSNLNYEGGCNPVNVTYLTGLGWKRQRDIVHQYAQNDQRVLPPSGLPIGNIQAGFQFLHHYQKELGTLTFPSDGVETQPYPFYDRWGDSFNVTTEFVIGNQGRGLAVLAFLMAQTPLHKQVWSGPPTVRIAGVPAGAAVNQEFTVRLEGSTPNLEQARVVWEAQDQEPKFGATFHIKADRPGTYWIEAEAQWPDGRRASARTNWMAR